uniref:LysM domain-containing protein n=1 Tax=Steinernema glaseri TaxID=37863 RepID=A0A1I7XWD1_9BILA
MHYEVKDNDTLERIAAAHDCTVGELMKLNKMASRMVFPGQKILVPAPPPDDVFVDAQSGTSSNASISSSNPQAPTNLGIYLGDGLPPNDGRFAEGKTRGPGGAVPIQSTNSKTNSPEEKTVITQERIEDSDCLQRFLKIKVKQLTESDGTVSGTLLVTPNCLMFDPDVQHPLVIENGSDLYGMVANMEEILSVSVYKDIDGLTGAKATKKRSVFDPDHHRSPEEASGAVAPIVEVAREEDKTKFAGGDSGSESFESATEDPQFPSGTSLSGSQMLTSIVEEDHHNGPSDLLRPTEKYCGKRRTVSDVTCEQSEAFMEEHLSAPQLLSAGSETDVVARPHSGLEPSTSVDSTTSLPGNNNNNNEKGSFFNRGSRYSPNVARRSFGRLGRTLSARASSVKGSVVSGTKTVVSHTKSAAGQVQTGIQSGARVIAQAPNNVVRMGSGLLHEVQDKPGQLMEMCDSFFALERTNSELSQSNATMKREQSLATLENLKQRTQQVRAEAMKKQKNAMFHCATSSDEMPDLFKPISQMISQNSDSELATTPPELPYYMAVRLDKVKKKANQKGGKYSVSSTSSYTSYDDDCKFGNRRKREFWYAIPRAKADAIYHFLLHWSPEKYGQDTLTSEESDEAKKNTAQKSFLVLEDDSLSMQKSPDMCNGQKKLRMLSTLIQVFATP